MNAEKFTELLRDPRRVEEVEEGELRQIAQDHPYSQAVQLLYALRLKNSSEHLFNQQLGRTSILTNDRSILFDLFEREQFLQHTDAEAVETLHTDESQLKETPVEKPTAEKENVEDLKAEPLVEHVPEQDSDKPETGIKEEVKTGSVEVTSAESKAEPEEEEDMSHLSASEKIKRILEKNRNLRREFEEKHAGRVVEVSDRIKQIQEKHRALQPRSEEVPDEKVPMPVESASPEPEQTFREVDINPQESPEEEEIFIPAGPVIANPENSSKEETPPELSEPVKAFTIDDEKDDSGDKEERKEQGETEEVSGTHSFGGWLKRYKTTQEPESEPEIKESPTAEKLGFEEKARLIDQFVEKLPKLKSKGKESLPAAPSPIHMGNISHQDEGALVTETLARVYISQGHYDKAIKAYRILKLKYPEKSSFFADRISEINKLKNNK